MPCTMPELLIKLLAMNHGAYSRVSAMGLQVNELAPAHPVTYSSRRGGDVLLNTEAKQIIRPTYLL